MRTVPASLTILGLLLAGCSGRSDDGTVSVAVIGERGALLEDGLRLGFGGQMVREATAEGLVAMDATGEVVPALAERWIVTDDGLSFIFRIRGADWPGGEAMDAQSVRTTLLATIRALEGTSLGLDLAKISEIRALTARVIEFRLKSPMPEFLQLLAQPELGLRREGRGTGPMELQADGESLSLVAIAPDQRGLPQRQDWEEDTLRINLLPASARAAVDAFRNGEVEAVFNGRLSTFPLADPGPLSRGTIRVDAALGLFGIRYRNTNGLLAEASRREALSMAIDREAILAPFNVAGWVPTTRIVAADLPGIPDTRSGRWASQDLSDRRAEASRRIASLGDPAQARLSIYLAPGPGSDLLFQELAENWASIGVSLERADQLAGADLELIDRLARYANPRWYLNQFNCDISRPICSPDADVLVDRSLDAATPQEYASLLAEAEDALLAAEAYIPLGAPIRWSLVRGGLEGFSENRWGRHPLYPIATAPIS